MIPPRLRSLLKQARSSLRQLAFRLLRPVRRHYCILDHITLIRAPRESSEIQNVRILAPAQRVQIASPDEDPFVRIGKYYREGWFDRPDIFVADLPDAYLCVDSGLVCTRQWKAVADLEYRLPYFDQVGGRRPRHVIRRKGTYATAGYCLAWNHFHWMVDCLPRLVSLAEAEPSTPVIIAMPETLGRVQRESLEIVLPPNFTVEYFPPNTWLQVERLVWPSLVSGRCNAFLPHSYFEAIRQPIFQKFNLPPDHPRKERLYISRQGAKARRIRNETSLITLLEHFGFRTLKVENMTFREQVETFHRADVVLAPHGAGLNLIFFAGEIPVIVLEPCQAPHNHFHTLARGLGQDFHAVLHPGTNEEADMEVNLPALKKILEEDLELQIR